MTNPHPSTIQQGLRELLSFIRPFKNRAYTEETAIEIHKRVISLFLTLANERIESLRGRIASINDYPMHNEFVKGELEVLSEEINYWKNFIKELNEIK